MKLYPHPRPLPTLRRTCGFFVSSGQSRSNASLSGPHIAPWRATTPLHPALSQFAPYSNKSAPHPSAPAQADSKYIALMRAASFKSLYQKRPSKTVRPRTIAPRGAPDTALRLSGIYFLASRCFRVRSKDLV